jgi:hypothetical protein
MEGGRGIWREGGRRRVGGKEKEGKRDWEGESWGVR